MSRDNTVLAKKDPTTVIYTAYGLGLLVPVLAIGFAFWRPRWPRIGNSEDVTQ
jgi:hypothetical protein